MKYFNQFISGILLGCLIVTSSMAEEEKIQENNVQEFAEKEFLFEVDQIPIGQ